MEEKKNNQIQAMDDDALENVSGGWSTVFCTNKVNGRLKSVGNDLSPDEIAKLYKAGYFVREEHNASGNYYRVFRSRGASGNGAGVVKDLSAILGKADQALDRHL